MASSFRLGLPGGDGSADVAVFISKVWKIVENPDYSSLIAWSDSGKTFVVFNYSRFAKEVLPLYFKHSNFNSFVRQLNLYGFRKVGKPDQGALAKMQTNEPMEFWHANFRRGHPELLHLVQRRNKSDQSVKSVATKSVSTEKSVQLSRVMNDIHQMKGRQQSIASLLDSMKHENQQVRRELSVLKEKHYRQQRVLNKIIQFLVHMVYKGKLPSARRRSARLMLPDPDSQPSPPKRMKNLPEPYEVSDVYDVQSPPLGSVQSIPSYSPVTPPQDAQVFSSAQILPGSLALAMYTNTSSSSSSSDPTAGGVVTMSSMGPLPSSLVLEGSTGTGEEIPLEDLVGSVLESSSDSGAAPLPSDLELLSTSSEFLLHPPPPSSLVSGSPPQQKLCLSDHLHHQQTGLDAFPELLYDQLSVDPSIISEFISASHPCPDYDCVDTARLLESLSSDDSANVPHESSLLSQGSSSHAIVPVSTPPGALVTDDSASSLQELLKASSPSPTETATSLNTLVQ